MCISLCSHGAAAVSIAVGRAAGCEHCGWDSTELPAGCCRGSSVPSDSEMKGQMEFGVNQCEEGTESHLTYLATLVVFRVTSSLEGPGLQSIIILSQCSEVLSKCAVLEN